MRWGFVLLLFLPSETFAQVVLNEVYYDHPGRDDGFEFIELFNGEAVSHSLDGWRIDFHDGASIGWRLVWTGSPGDSIGALDVFVVGADLVSPPADAKLTVVLQNGPDAVRLVGPDGRSDRLGYGALTDPLYFESLPAPDAPEGKSLARDPDGMDRDDNAGDFVLAVPSPGRLNRPRNDVAIEPGPDLVEIRGLREAAVDSLRIWIRNSGSLPVEAGLVRVELSDTVGTVATARAVQTVERGIPVGQRVALQLAYAAAPGYHRLGLRARFDADERPGNNEIALFRRVGTPALLISEVMSHPEAGCPEYVEVVNASVAPYDLSGHAIRDRVNDAVTIDAAVGIVSPGAVRVIVADANSFASCFPGVNLGSVATVAGRWPSLNHTGAGEADSVVIVDAWGLDVDRVAYPAQPDDARGQSLERVDLYPGERQHVWMLSKPSPGVANPHALTARPTGSSVSVSPNPFDPSAGESIVIVVAETLVWSEVRLAVFDFDGRRLKAIGATNRRPFVFVWNGRDEMGRLIDPGFYILSCEQVNAVTGDRSVEKVVLGCGHKRNP